MPWEPHSLLRRQMRRHLPGGAVLPLGWEAFLHSVDQAYRQADDDRQMVERSLDISSRELHDANQNMRLAKEAAEQAAVAKGEFLANMSHEIRTPMNAVIGLTALLLETRLTAEQREYLETVCSAGESLLHIINDILDYSKIESRRLELEHCPMDVRECVESSVELFGLRAAEQGLELVCHVDRSVPSHILGDSTRIRQILLNLIGNAVKFTATGEIAVEVSASPIADRSCELEISVRDTGIGIPAGKMDRLFQSFSQVDPSTTRKYGGTGLGLAISWRLAELMGGRMWAASELGRGSRFAFTIRAEIHAASSPAPAGVFAGKRALVVDEHAGARHSLSALLGAMGVAVSAAESAAAAKDLLAQQAFDLVAIDAGLNPPLSAGAPPVLLLTRPGLNLGGATDGIPQLSKPVRALPLQTMLGKMWGASVAQPKPAQAAAAALDATLAGRQPLQILLAEDNGVNQRVILKMLERFGYLADLAQTGKEVLDMVAQKRYDLIMMDVHMPEMDGLEATRLLVERIVSTERPRIVALTASVLQEDRERCLRAGMDEYVTKPIHVRDLKQVLDNCAASIAVKPRRNPGSAALSTVFMDTAGPKPLTA